jgi:ATP-dependent Lon protease
MNIVSSGVVRYRVEALRESTPFIVASVEPLSDDLEADAEVTRMVSEMASTCRRFLAAAQALDESNAPPNEDLPDDPELFSLMVCSNLPIKNDVKQSLLEMTSTRVRLTRMRHYLNAALTEYSGRLTIQQRAKGNGHGKVVKQ